MVTDIYATACTLLATMGIYFPRPVSKQSPFQTPKAASEELSCAVLLPIRPPANTTCTRMQPLLK